MAIRERRAGGHGRFERNGAGLPRGRGRAAERMAALGLRRNPEPQRDVARERARAREEARGVPALQLDLGLADRGHRAAGPDRAAIERQLGDGALREREHPGRALELGDEDGPQPRAHPSLREEPGVRRRIEQGDVDCVAGDVPLDLVARVQARRGLPPALQRLDPALAVVTQPQRDAGARQRTVGRVVVDRLEPLPVRPAPPHRTDRRVTVDPREVLGRDEELQLDFHRHARRAR